MSSGLSTLRELGLHHVESCRVDRRLPVAVWGWHFGSAWQLPVMWGEGILLRREAASSQVQTGNCPFQPAAASSKVPHRQLPAASSIHTYTWFKLPASDCQFQTPSSRLPVPFLSGGSLNTLPRADLGASAAIPDG